MQNQTINLELTVEKLNIILQALAKMPFAAVAELIGEVQQAAQAQLKPAEASNDAA